MNKKRKNETEKMRKTNAAKLIKVFFWLVYFIIESLDAALCLLLFASIDLQRLHLFLFPIFCCLMLNCCFCYSVAVAMDSVTEKEPVATDP